MSWHVDVVLSYELGGRVCADLREETFLPHFIVDILQHRIDHPSSGWRWPMPDKDLQYEGEVVQWSWQHARCSGLRPPYAYGPLDKRCNHAVRLDQPTAARHVMGEDVEVYCSWCAHDLAIGHGNVARPAAADDTNDTLTRVREAT